MTTLSDKLRHFLRNKYPEWVHKGVMTDDMTWTRDSKGTRYMAESVGKALRNLESESVIAVKDDINRKSVLYKWIPHDIRSKYINTSSRLPGRTNVLFNSQTK